MAKRGKSFMLRRGSKVSFQGSAPSYILSDSSGFHKIAHADLNGSHEVVSSFGDVHLIRVKYKSYALLKQESRAVRAEWVLDAWSAVLPQRIVNEDLWDFIEDIRRRAASGQRWLLFVRLVAAIVWTGVNAVGYFGKAVGSRKAN